MSYKIVKYASVFPVTDEVAVRRLAHEIGEADWLREVKRKTRQPDAIPLSHI